MKKELKIVISVFLAVWCFFMGFELGSYREKRAADSNNSASPVIATTAQTPVTTTQAPVTTTAAPEPTSEKSTASANTNANADVTKATKAPAAVDPASMSKEQIIEAVTKAVNTVKNEQNMTAKKVEKVTINLTDLSVASLKGVVNGIIQRLAGDDDYTYTFTNGQGTGVDNSNGKPVDDGATVTPNSVIPPADKTFTLPAEAVVEATAKKDGDKTVYAVKLVEESTTYDAPIPKYHENAYGYLNLAGMNIPTVTISSADLKYPGTTIEVTVDANGKTTAIHYLMPMNGYGAAKLPLGSGNASFEGSDDEAWVFTY